MVGDVGDMLELPPAHPVETVSDKPVNITARRVTSAALARGNSTRRVVMRKDYVGRSLGTKRKQAEWLDLLTGARRVLFRGSLDTHVPQALTFQCVSSPLVQIKPGTPPSQWCSKCPIR